MELYLYGCLIAVISFIIGTIHVKRKYRKILSKGTGRYGIIECTSGYSSFFIEIEEIETAGEWTKVRLIDVCESRSSSEATTSDLLKKCGFNEWTQTRRITWFDNNSQKVRDKKLNEILGKTE